jgi:hypothetical protein
VGIEGTVRIFRIIHVPLEGLVDAKELRMEICKGRCVCASDHDGYRTYATVTFRESPAWQGIYVDTVSDLYRTLNHDEINLSELLWLLEREVAEGNYVEVRG